MEETRKPLKNWKFHIHTFGCQMNENDSERIAGLLQKEGARMSGSPEESDLVILNTCAVREKAEEKLYSLLGRMESIKKARGLMIGVVGCVAQLYRSQLLEKRPFIDFILGPDNYDEIPHILEECSSEKVVATNWSREWREYFPHPLSRESRFSAYVTIMEGCNSFCSYCIVPFTRGREKFRPLSNILREVRELADEGYREIQLLGQNVNSYRDPESGKGFPDLLREVNRISGIGWVRFITSHPKNFTAEIVEAMRDSEKVCHQLHLPVQSGSNDILMAMNRGYTREEYLEEISLIRSVMPDISLSTDVIVGFPGETKKHFRETLSLLEEVHFSNIFSFRYSPRPLTAASRKKDTVPFEEKKRRLIELQNFQKQIQLELNSSYIGRVVRVLCLGKSKKDLQRFSGRNEGYQVVNFVSEKDVIGQFVDVRITSCGPYSLVGEAVS
ncbi:MAG: tRNA (N6-isopentenyl adenosine(37)-C2)-methylthiotransferase MiaB [Candidatus Aminicenantales bacterium]